MVLECARDPCFNELKIGGKVVGLCMQEKGHSGPHQCVVQWEEEVNDKT